MTEILGSILSTKGKRRKEGKGEGGREERTKERDVRTALFGTAVIRRRSRSTAS